MKRLIFFFIVLINLNSYAQSPSCADCNDKSYPYFFCENGTPKTICTDDPNQNTTLFVPAKSVMKRTLPICYIYDGSKYPSVLPSNLQYPKETQVTNQYFFHPISIIIPKNANPTYPADYAIMFDIDDIDPNSGSPSQNNLINKAVKRWMLLCMTETEYNTKIASGPKDNCCITIGWSDNHDDFKLPDGGYAIAITRQHMVGYCLKPCSDIKILFDCSEKFYEYKSVVGGMRPTTYWVTTDEIIPDTNPLRPGEDYSKDITYSYYATLLHELGHWLGFNHDGQTDSYGNDCGPYDAPDSWNKSIMGKHIGKYVNTKEYPTKNAERDLTSEDECRFKKLYCCPHTRTKSWWDHFRDIFAEAQQSNTNVPGLLSISVDVHPNPNSGSILFFDLPSNALPIASVGFAIVNNSNGNVVINQELSTLQTEYQVDISTLSNGAYTLYVQYDDKYGYTQFVVSR